LIEFVCDKNCELRTFSFSSASTVFLSCAIGTSVNSAVSDYNADNEVSVNAGNRKWLATLVSADK